MKIIETIKRKVEEILFPSGYKCLLCSKEINDDRKSSFCDECLFTLPFNDGKICKRCGNPLYAQGDICDFCRTKFPKFVQCRSPFLYKDSIAFLIKQLKYDNKKYIAQSLSYFMLAEYMKINHEADVVVPVPLFPAHQVKRGYNQSELLCHAFTEKGMAVNTKILTRVKDTSTQTDLSYAERKENVKDAFSVSNKQSIAGKNVLLVDDVFTTGSTINECSKTLLKAGAKRVFVVTLAHAERVGKNEINAYNRE